MKKYIVAIGLTYFAASLGCTVKKQQASGGASDAQFKILCYNIHHANPPSKAGYIDLDAIARVITESKADVVALQEVDKNTERCGKVDQAKLLAEKTGMNFQFFKAIDHDKGEYGLAILSRLKLKNAQSIPLPQQFTAEKRILAYATVEVAGREVVFANTHLDASRTPENRTVQMKAILDHFRDAKSPVILCGDLNSVADTEAIKMLDEQFVRTCIKDCPGTIPQVNPRRTIDYIATKNVSWPLLNYQVVDEAYASDHRPITASFSIK